MLPTTTTGPGGYQVRYLTCGRGGLHEDERLNLVCL